jgi:hypothetical protein
VKCDFFLLIPKNCIEKRMVPSGDVDIHQIRLQLELNNLSKNQILDLFEILEQIKITKACLAETKIANTISKYKKNSDTEIVQRCKSLLRQWRDALTQTLKTPSSSTHNGVDISLIFYGTLYLFLFFFSRYKKRINKTRKTK